MKVTNRILFLIFCFAIHVQGIANEKIIAHIGDQVITQQQVEPTDVEKKYIIANCKDSKACLKQHRYQKLNHLISSTLFEKIVKDQKLDATPVEIERLRQKIQVLPEYAAQMIIQWKVNQFLYRNYGGDVIFQQSNPLEPIGAYEAFFKEQEKLGSFVIDDEEFKAQFWKYYELPRIVIPEREVNYDVPWWNKGSDPNLIN